MTASHPNDAAARVWAAGSGYQCYDAYPSSHYFDLIRNRGGCSGGRFWDIRYIVDGMAFDFQVVVDTADPHPLADWWADALGWVVEPTDETFIRKMIADGLATENDTKLHNGALVWKDGAAIRHPDGPERGARKRILFQLVPELKTVKNRVHLDVWVGPENVEAELARLTANGAAFLHRGQQGPHTWVTIADPEGNEFCVS